MPKNVYFWSRKESAQHDTERHEVFRKELYPLYNGNVHLTHAEWDAKLKEFKEKNFDLLEGLKNGLYR